MQTVPLPAWMPRPYPELQLPLSAVGAVIMDAGHQVVATCPNSVLADALAFTVNNSLCPEAHGPQQLRT